MAARASASDLLGWLPVATKFGVGGLIALYLVYVMAGGHGQQLEAVARGVDAVHVKQDAHQLSMTHEFDARRQAAAAQVRLLEAICRNTAKSADAEANCGLLASLLLN